MSLIPRNPASLGRSLVLLPLFTSVLLLFPPSAAAKPHSGWRHPCLEAMRLDFGARQVGARAESSLTVKNRCPRPVTIWKVTGGAPAFSATLTAPLRIPPRSSRPLPVAFAPEDTGLTRAILVLHTNFARRKALAVVAGRGVAAPAPSLTVAPASVSLALEQARTDTFRLSVTNHGTEPRAEILVDAIGDPLPRPESGWRVLYLHTVPGLPDEDEFAVLLAGFEKVDTAESWFAGDTLPSLSRLLEYDVVMTAAVQPWKDPTRAGDLLAQYLEAGGKVLLTAGVLQESGSPLAGRILDYSPIGPADAAPGGSSDALVSHPITEGVGDFSSLDVLQVSATRGQGAGIPLGTYTNGFLVGAYHPDKPLVFLNLGRGFSGDVPRLLENALDYLGGMMAWATPRPPFDPVIFVVPVGETRELAVAVNTHRLPPGDHTGAIRLRNVSIPGEDPIDVPVRLTVSARSSLIVAPESLAVTLPQNLGVADTLRLENPGTDTLRLTFRPVVDAADGRPASGPEEMHILYLHAAGESLEGDSLLPALLALHRVRSLTGYPASDSLPDLAYLQRFDAVLVASSGPWADREVLGDRLADYVDAGGRLCLMHPSLVRQTDRPELGLGGRILDPVYLPVEPGPGIRGGYVDRFTDNPLTEGVIPETRFHSDSVMEMPMLRGRGHFLGWYFNGSMVGGYGYEKAVVFLNVQPVQGFHDLVETVKLLDNTFAFLSRYYNWFISETRSLSLAPGQAADLPLVFGAPYGPEAGVYSGRLEIRIDRAGGGDLVTVPVSLTVEASTAAATP